MRQEMLLLLAVVAAGVVVWWARPTPEKNQSCVPTPAQPCVLQTISVEAPAAPAAPVEYPVNVESPERAR